MLRLLPVGVDSRASYTPRLSQKLEFKTYPTGGVSIFFLKSTLFVQNKESVFMNGKHIIITQLTLNIKVFTNPQVIIRKLRPNQRMQMQQIH